MVGKPYRPLPLLQRLKTMVIGGARNIFDPALFHNISLIAIFAWVGLGADGLSSSCYGPEEAYLALGTHVYLSLFVALATGITVIVISISYSQIIELFPTGGGGYLVASKLLSPATGMVSGCALIIDYVLTITISIASGADAIFSFLPPGWIHLRLAFAVFFVAVLTILNMRGVKESVIPLVPVFMVFILMHAFFILYALGTHVPELPQLAASAKSEIQRSQAELGFLGMVFLVLKAYSMGAGTFTGIEAVSNGLPILRDPKVKTGKKTMTYMAASLSLVVMGLTVSYLLYRVGHQPGKTLNAVLFETVVRGWGKNAGNTAVLVTLVSEAVLLLVAAQTGFLDGPRVLASMALDRWFPTKYASFSDRLVTQKGIMIMGGAAFAVMLLTKGSVKLLVVFYSINVFITFFLSQLGMVRHWWLVRDEDAHWKKKFATNGLGTILTAFILLSVVVLKFSEGGWITIMITGSLVAVAVLIKRHYLNTAQLLKRLDGLIEVVWHSPGEPLSPGPVQPPAYDRGSGTAVLLVSGFNGLGLHTLLNIFRLLRQSFKNFVFIQVGIVDAGTFKGAEDLERLRLNVKDDLDRYVEFVYKHGYYAEGVACFGTDVVEEIAKAAPGILDRFPDAVFFGGQLVFPNPSIFTGMLHNYTIFAVQRYFYTQGIPIVMMPIRADGGV
ncbi:MAG: APC family permease [bacterium]